MEVDGPRQRSLTKEDLVGNILRKSAANDYSFVHLSLKLVLHCTLSCEICQSYFSSLQQ